MALIVEDGTGLSTAEAYISVADADTYFAAYGAPAEWTASTTGQKETALRIGCQYLDAKYAGRYKGTRTNETQALAFPRADIIDNDDFGIDDDVIPVDLGRANAEAALRQRQGTDLLADQDEPSSIKREMVKVGPITEDISYESPKSSIPSFPKIDRLLIKAGLINPPGEFVRG